MTDTNEHPTGYVDLTAPSNADAPTDAMEETPGENASPASSGRTGGTDSPAAGSPSDEAHDGKPANVAPLFPLPDLRATLNGDAEPDVDADHEEFKTVYDIIDKLEAMLDEAKPSIFSGGQVKVDRDEFTGQLDELKKMLPVQLERASALMRESERRLESAQTQANAIVASAQSRAADTVREANEQAQFLAGQENVTELARQKARAILDDAQAKSDRLTRGADEYSTKIMTTLRQQLTKMAGDVDAGLNVLEERRKAASESTPHLTLDDYPEAR